MAYRSLLGWRRTAAHDTIERMGDDAELRLIREVALARPHAPCPARSALDLVGDGGLLVQLHPDLPVYQHVGAGHEGFEVVRAAAGGGVVEEGGGAVV